MVCDSASRPRRPAYRRREPEHSALYRIVEDHLPAFFERLDARDSTAGGAGAAWPGFVRDEFEAYLRCGLLVHGFVRVRCATCGHDALVGFS
jgi:hypothetical protein